MRGWPLALLLGGVGVGFALGRSGAPPAAFSSPLPTVLAPADPREVIPLTPGPGEGPGAGPPRPGQAPGAGECTVLMFKDGQFYRMQPGTPRPGGPGPDGTGPNGTGPGGDGELFPLQPPMPAPDAPPFPVPEMRS